jgi:hypothetical protein
MNLTHQLAQSQLPDIIFVGGKKRSGKDYLCDLLVERAGFTKYHIVRGWLEGFAARHRISYAEYEAHKEFWRHDVQAEASAARAADPDCLVNAFREILPTLPRPLCVTAVRFANECLFGMEVGAMVVRVATSDRTRRERFIASGTSLELFDDPFEHEVDLMPAHLEMSGEMDADNYIPTLAGVYRELSRLAFTKAGRERAAR